MDLFWLVILIGYFLFKVLIKKLPDMTRNFPGDWGKPDDTFPARDFDVTNAENSPAIRGQLNREREIKLKKGELGLARREGESKYQTAKSDTRRGKLTERQLETQYETQYETISHPDWVNGIIMSEVLQPPLARRKKR